MSISRFIISVCFMVSSIAINNAWSANFAPLAVINDHPITQFDLEKRLKLLSFMSGKTPDATLLPSVKTQILKALVEESLQKQEFTKYPTLVLKEKSLSAAIANFASQKSMTIQQLEDALTQNGLALNDVKDFLKTQILWNDLTTGKFASAVHVNRSEIERILENILANAGDEVLVSILKRPIDRADEAQKQAQSLTLVANKIRSGGDFASLASQIQQSGDQVQLSPTWIAVGQLHNNPAFLQALKTAPAGSVFGPIPYQNSLMLVQVQAYRHNDVQGLSYQLSYKEAVIPFEKDASIQTLSALQTQLLQIKAESQTCDDFENSIESLDGTISDKQAEASKVPSLAGLDKGQISASVKEEEAFKISMVCDKIQSESLIESHQQLADQIKRKLFSEKLNGLSRHYLRELQHKATVKLYQTQF